MAFEKLIRLSDKQVYIGFMVIFVIANDKHGKLKKEKAMKNVKRVPKSAIFALLFTSLLFFANYYVAPLQADSQFNSATLNSGSSEAVKLIFDTDMDSDCDDTGALAMLHALADNGDVDIVVVMICSRNEHSASAADVINTYYGRGDIPIGQIQTGVYKKSLYTGLLASQFEHDATRDSCPDAVTLYRQILSQAADSSIVIATVGYLSNLEDLLKSEADEHSSLNGYDLVAQKVKKYVCMGSRYPGRTIIGGGGNFEPDPEATDYVVNNWPTLIHFTGGGSFAWDCATGDRMDETPESNPVRVAYEEFLAKNSWTKKYDPTRTKLHSADQIAVWVAVKGIDPFFTQVTDGYNFIYEDGTHKWMTDRDDPNQRYTSGFADGVTAEQVSDAFNDLMVKAPAATSVKDQMKAENHPADFQLSQNYPNPFNASTTIVFSLPKKEFVTLKVYDSLGREIETLAKDTFNAGLHKIHFSTINFNSGLYWYRIQAGNYSETKKMLYVK